MSNIRVLVVDDSEFVLNKLNEILEKAGFNVVGLAKNGIDALRLYKELKPDIVTLDINMPDMDGLATLKFLKQMDNTAKVIMCTSISTKQKVIEALQAGAKNFIAKPFVPEKVVAVITKTAFV